MNNLFREPTLNVRVNVPQMTLEQIMLKYKEDFEIAARQAVDKVMAEFDWKSYLTKSAKEILETSLRRKIESAIYDCLSYDTDVADLLKKAVISALQRSMKGDIE